ncbi:hypothetical protein [Alienimonas californiensis]|nr:hypothetical protein [Alienimonas californiensis]
MRHPLKAGQDRKSRMHVLDLLGRPDRREALDQLIETTGFRLADEPTFRPLSREEDDAAEYELERYLRESNGQLPTLDDEWWFPNRDDGGAGPVWDLIATLAPLQEEPSPRPALLLVEAKAHVGELKHKDPQKPLPPDASPERIKNRHSILGCINETQMRLNRAHRGRKRLSTADRYQLMNRLAYACKMASEGCDVVLMYLGFLGDRGIKKGEWLRDDRHWQRAVGAYVRGRLPQWTLDRPLTIQDPGSEKSGTLWFIARSLPVTRNTPS